MFWRKNKVDIYNLIEMNAFHALALKSNFDIYVPNHIVFGKISAREVIDGHTWETFGKSGRDDCKKVFLKDCETEHLQNILRTQSQITSITTLVIVAILMERKAFKGMK